jgi:signal transduction histidine kinase
LATTRPLAHLSTNFPWLHRWIYYLAAGIMYAAATLRAYIIFQNDPILDWILLLLTVWLLMIVGATLFTRQLPWLTVFALVLDASLIFILLLITGQDFFAFLFAILGMRAMQQYSPQVLGGLLGLCAILTFLALIGSIGLLQALALALTYSALGAFLAAYIWSTRQAGVIQQEQQALVEELQQANHRLEFRAHQQEQLAAGRERQHLARELHDSVTQTIFSMTLTSQSALLLLERDRVQVQGQLDRLDQLSQGAMAEMQELISRLAPQAVSGDFITLLQHHLEERRRLDNLAVTLEVEGDHPLDSAEQTSLFRIAQEALNNIVKHARVNQALIRLHLEEPFWMEIEDSGCGFDKQEAFGRERMGMAGMGERATEMGWTLQVTSSPGFGTRIRVEKRTPGEKHP